MSPARSRWDARVRRRRRVALGALLVALAVGVGAYSTGRDGGGDAAAAAAPSSPDGTAGATEATTATGAASAASSTARKQRKPKGESPVPALPPIPAARPGQATVVTAGRKIKAVALTFDDGFCAECLGALVREAERSKARVTFCPNGTYHEIWDRYAKRIRVLLARKRAVMCNHTWSHRDLKTLSDAEIEAELTRNEEWIEKAFGVTSRPWFRPPYGSYDDRTVAIAGKLGFTTILMWSGTLADSSPRSEAYIAKAVRDWAAPGAIILGHGNYPATGDAFPQMLRELHRKGLKTATVAELVPQR